jgi:hypothetical protein
VTDFYGAGDLGHDSNPAQGTGEKAIVGGNMLGYVPTTGGRSSVPTPGNIDFNPMQGDVREGVGLDAGFIDYNPQVKDLPETAKSSSIFAQPAMIRDATILNNPAVDSLHTISWGSPLLSGFADTQGQAHGADPVSYFSSANMTTQDPTPQDASATGAPDSAAAPKGTWLLKALGLRDSAYKETGVFIVGAIILIAGVFALTR